MQHKSNKLRVKMERVKVLRPIVNFLRKSGFVGALHSLQNIANKQKMQKEAERFNQYYRKYKEEYRCVYNSLADEFSKRTYEDLLLYLSGKNRRNLKKDLCYPQYFLKNIFTLSKDAVFIDGGAYIGDTIEEFLKFTKGKYKKIYAWEPDKENCRLLQKAVASERVEIIQKGLWNKKDILCFTDDAAGFSRISDSGEASIETDTIDNICWDEKISMIKMDIEGSEMNALSGAKKVILRDKPILAICIYHSWRDMHQIPMWIKEIVPEYKIYIRAHSDTGAEVVVYAVYEK